MREKITLFRHPWRRRCPSVARVIWRWARAGEAEPFWTEWMSVVASGRPRAFQAVNRRFRLNSSFTVQDLMAGSRQQQSLDVAELTGGCALGTGRSTVAPAVSRV